MVDATDRTGKIRAARGREWMTAKAAQFRSVRLCLLASAGAMFFAVPALAQQADDTAASDDSHIIVVTAQKREQDVQDVPISLTVVGGEQLSELGIKDFNELDRYVPNFYVQTTPGNNAFYIRGIGSTPGNLAF